MPFRSEAHVVGTSTSPTVAAPSGALEGDFFLALALAASGNALLQPAGWIVLFTGTQGGVMWNLSWIFRPPSAPSMTWTHTGSIYREVFVCAFSGIDRGIGIDAISAAGASGNAAINTHTPDPPAATALQANGIACCGGLHFHGSVGGWTAPAGYTIRSDNTAGNDGVMATKQLTATGSENPAAFTTGANSIANDYWDGFTVILRHANPAIEQGTNEDHLNQGMQRPTASAGCFQRDATNPPDHSWTPWELLRGLPGVATPPPAFAGAGAVGRATAKVAQAPRPGLQIHPRRSAAAPRGVLPARPGDLRAQDDRRQHPPGDHQGLRDRPRPLTAALQQPSVSG